MHVLRAVPLLALVLLASCKPKAGGRCRGDIAACVDESNALFCVDGKYRATPCRGVNGCKGDLVRTTCDESVAVAGDPCTGSGVACSPDGTAYLKCKGGVFALDSPCKGPKACWRDGSMVRCDQSEGDVGDACSSTGAACTTDHTGFLECDGASYKLKLKCRGPKACHHDGTQVLCDATIGEVGDPCTSGATCSADHATFLNCNGGKYEGTPCRGKHGCSSDGDTVHCDKSVARAGDDCQNGVACTEDGKKLLACVSGKRVVSRGCARGCTVGEPGADGRAMVTCR